MSVLGIDLGTTNTVAAMDGAPLEIPMEDGRTTLPSVVSFLPNGSTQVGLAAKRRRSIDHRNTIFSAKRIIGRRWSDAKTQEFSNRFPLELVESAEGTPAFATRAGQFTPTDIASVLLSATLDQARQLAGDCDTTIVTVPVAFGARQRSATSDAAEKAGFAKVRLIDEAMATAYAYMNVSNPVARAGIYDLGGGTFDFSIVDWTRGTPRVLGYESDLFLGGDDVDHQITEWVAARILEEHNWDLRNNSEVYARLVAECERAKIRLCFFEKTTIDLSQIDPQCPAAAEGLPFPREIIDRISTDIVRQTFVTCDSVLASTGVAPGDLDALFLAGGSTHLAGVRDGIQSYFGKPGRFELEPTEVVAMGASMVPASTGSASIV